MHKRNLKNNRFKIVLSEDLTKSNHDLLKLSHDEKFENNNILVDSFWTRDGKILIKEHMDKRPVRVKTSSDFDEFLEAAEKRAAKKPSNASSEPTATSADGWD